jgi:UDP-N-acetylmuramoylalanine--D-glutamate ligase
LTAAGARVVAVDQADTPALRTNAAALAESGVRVILGAGVWPEDFYAVCVVSPGVPPVLPAIRRLAARGIPVISELELGWAACPTPVLAITGTAGKSTLCKLCFESLTGAGKRAVLGGNYGTPMTTLALESQPWDWLVVEVSSFQLELIRRFHPRVGVLLNIYPNHLDRHQTLSAYIDAKLNLFRYLTPQDQALVCDETLPFVRTGVPELRQWKTFGLTPAAHWRFEAGRLKNTAATIEMDVRGTPFDNAILGVAAAAAASAMEACGVDPATVATAARQFEKLPHRMEEVAVIQGVRFIDDSKATTLAALAAGVQMAPGRVRLIAGGRLKEEDVNTVKKILAKKAEAIYLIGECSGIFAAAWSDAVRCEECGDLAAAVTAAVRAARRGETVLLSPGCASFDQFNGFEERGRKFKEMVNALERRGSR